MKVILQQDIQYLGEAGDIKEVSDGYARNYLLPKKLVILSNEVSKKAMEHQKRLIRRKKEKRRNRIEKLAESLTGIEVSMNAQVGEEGKLFGSVTSIDIAKKLKELGYEIDKRKIQLVEPIKHIGRYEVPIKLDEGFTAKVAIIVDKE
ncbi:MAG: 50S ribosomal protein L9 [Spirochaetota bacterium]|nr:50S ribosomal protein L9 [Spirochaetota bacterium]